MRRWVFLASMSLWSVAASAEAPPEPFLLLEVTPDCASDEQDAILQAELELRMPGTFLVRGSVGSATPTWRVIWRPLPDYGCELVFSSAGNRSTMELGPNANQVEIELAASRVAWLASVSPGSQPTSEELAPEVPPEPLVEDEPALEIQPPPTTEPAPAEEPVVPPPIEEPPVEVLPAQTDVEAPAFHPVKAKVSIAPHWVVHPDPLPDRAVPRLSVNFVAGSSHGLEGFELGGAYNHESSFANGFQAAIGANLVDGDANAIQLAGGLNRVRGEFRGAALALGANVASSSKGAQLALGFNYAGAVRGAQLALGGNLAGGDSGGLQAAVGINVADTFRGLQLGLLNIAGEVDGPQIGLVNLAKSTSASVGLVSIEYAEPFYFTAWGTTVGGAIVGVQNGGSHLRYSYLAGVDFGLAAPAGKLGAGLGGHFPIGRAFVDSDVLVFWQVPFGELLHRVSLQPQLKLSVGWQFAERFAVFGGASAVALWSGLANAAELTPDRAVEVNLGAGARTRLFRWWELHAGLRF